MDALTLHRIHFAFTITYHYLFPQLTMGLALLIVVLKTMALRTSDERYNVAARFWARIFSVNFLLGVVTGIPMEFQFGTNWSEFSRRTGGVIGQPLAMEGVFSFFLESAFLGLFLFGEKRLSQVRSLGSSLSGISRLLDLRLLHHRYRCVDAASGGVSASAQRHLRSLQLLGPHDESLGMAAVRAQYVRCRHHGGFRHGCSRRALCAAEAEGDYGRIFLKLGVLAGLVSCIAQIFPTGDLHGKYMAKHQPVAMAGMEGLFHSEKGAPIVLMGQPDIEAQKIDNPLAVNDVLSFLIYGTTAAEVRGLDQFPRDQWPSTLPLLFYSYHIMAGLGTYFAALMVVAGIPAVAGKALHDTLGALADPAQLSAAVYCEYCRLDDCRDRSPALAGLRTAPHVGGLLEAHRRWNEPVHSAGFPRPVYCALYSLDRARLHHDSEGSEPSS